MFLFLACGGSKSNEIIDWHSLVWVVYVGTTKWATFLFFFLFHVVSMEWMDGWNTWIGLDDMGIRHMRVGMDGRVVE